MPVVNEGLEEELGYVSRAFEQEHIRAQWDHADPLMQEISYQLIVGNHIEVDRLTIQALEDDFSANTILDDGLIAGMAIVGIKFRDNIIFVPEVLVAARAMKAGMAHVEPILSASRDRACGYGDHGDCEGRPSRHRQEPVHHDAEGRGFHRPRSGGGYLAGRVHRGGDGQRG